MLYPAPIARFSGKLRLASLYVGNSSFIIPFIAQKFRRTPSAYCSPSRKESRTSSIGTSVTMPVALMKANPSTLLLANEL